MAAKVLLLGGGDVGLRMADGLLRLGGVAELTVADRPGSPAGAQVAMLACCHEAKVGFQEVDGCDALALEALLLKARPDLIIQAASLISPWSIIGRDHPTARALAAAGIALQLPAQLPIVTNLMTVVRELGLSVPVANISMPDGIHPILATRGLAPTIGLGNVSILQLRIQAALKARGDERPLVRVVGHHHHVYGAMTAKAPADPELFARVYLGEDGAREDELAYAGQAFAPGPIYNVITAAAALPVLSALLPGAPPRRLSAPAPQGLPGGYPVSIDRGQVTLDLPENAKLQDAVAFNRRIGKLDGIEEIAADGAVAFTEAARDAVGDLDPGLAAPLDPWNLTARTNRLLDLIQAMGPR
ncbi:MAG: hypothetical protein AAF495_12115 [Pseudomonadota bacterium]